jgi:hypothetical protein
MLRLGAASAIPQSRSSTAEPCVADGLMHARSIPIARLRKALSTIAASCVSCHYLMAAPFVGELRR